MTTAQAMIRLVDPRTDSVEVERARQQRAAELDAETIRPVKLNAMVVQYPELRPYVVDGLLRNGETANIIASPKVGKSFLAGNLACCIASGRPWFARDIRQGNVLILDNELHPETLAHRLDRIANEMQLVDEDRERIEIIHLRGQVMDLNNFTLRLAIQPGKYSLIILDALYRTIPMGVNENDNAAMMAIYNQLDSYAVRWGAAIVVVHHSSKGAQGEKSVTDVGSGAGSISRAADTHMVIRPHETEGLCVMEAVTRSFKSPDPISIKFDWPIWNAVTVAPEVKRANVRTTNSKKAEDKQDAEDMLLAIPLSPDEIQQNDLFAAYGHGIPKCERLVGQLIQSNRVKRDKRALKKGGRKYVFYSRIPSDSNSNPGSVPELQTEPCNSNSGIRSTGVE